MLTRLWFLLEDSVDIGLVSAFKWPMWLVWVGFAVVAVVSLRNHMKASAQARVSPSVLWLGVLAIFPVAMLCVGEIYWESATRDPLHPAVIALFVLGSLQLLLSYALIWKFRSRPIFSLAVPAFGIIWGLGTFFLSGFSVTGTWP